MTPQEEYAAAKRARDKFYRVPGNKSSSSDYYVSSGYGYSNFNSYSNNNYSTRSYSGTPSYSILTSRNTNVYLSGGINYE